jgi:hypothetical protein
MPVETRNSSQGRQQEEGRDSPGRPHPQRNSPATGIRTGVSKHVQKQLLQDIEASGEGIAGFKLRTLLAQKPCVYDTFQSDTHKQFQNKLHQWKLLNAVDCYELLCTLGVHPNGTNQESEEEEEEEQEDPTPTPPARQHHCPHDLHRFVPIHSSFVQHNQRLVDHDVSLFDCKSIDEGGSGLVEQFQFFEETLRRKW